MIAVDDLNAWSTVLGTYAAPLDTPNLDRLRAAGVNFTNANAAVPLCNPARAAVLTGMSPLSSGVFDNTQDMFDYVSVAQTLPAQLRAAGYETVLAGKVFHGLTDAQAAALYDTVLSIGSGDGTEREKDERTPTATTAPAGIYTGDPALLSDARNVSLALDVLANHVPTAGSAGLFLSVGLTSTHLPWAVPQAYFDRYPLADIVLPETPPGDLADLPDFALQFIDPVKFDRVLDAGEWRALVQAYLATMAYMDDMLGRLLDGLQASAIADDTMVVFWSDHGFHLGDKEMITTKLSLWEPATRAPLIIADPAASGRAGTDEAQVVSMLDVYSTILDYAGIAAPAWADGQSLLGLVRNGDASGLAGAAVTLIDGNFSLRTEQYRYTRYEDGSEELYDMIADPRQFTNLAGDPALAAVLADLSAQLDAYLGQFNLHQNRGAVPTLLQGGADKDVLIAGFAADTLAGGDGDDVYLLRDGSEVVVEAAGGGTDRVLLAAAQLPYRLPDHVEGLQLGRSGFNPPEPAVHVLFGNALDNTINAFVFSRVWIDAGDGNDNIFAALPFGPSNGFLMNATVFGGEGADSILGGANDDQLSGDAGNDTLSGGARGNDSLMGGSGNDQLRDSLGDDTLDGGLGNDAMSGGEGSDTYIVSAGADRIIERGTTGFDTLDVSRWGSAGFRVTEVLGSDGRPAAFLYRSLDGADSVRLAALDGRNPIEAIRDAGVTRLISGNAFVAGSGDDHVIGTAEADSLSGQAGNDVLEGGGGADTLDGGRGMDTLRGGAGDDRYLVDDLGDVATEFDSEGHDRVMASVSWTLGAFFEDLTLVGTAAAGTGNRLANLITGHAGPNTLSGGHGDDTLIGGAGSDVLSGGLGADSMAGGLGNERYSVDSALDVVVEAPGEGIDLVVASLSWTLGDSIERLQLSGTGDTDGIGNGLANRIVGNAGANALSGLDGNDQLYGGEGADTLDGGAGTDVLVGQGGADRFVFAAQADGVDRIMDFTGAEDLIVVMATGFGGGLSAGALDPSRFVAHASAKATSEAGTAQFIYHTTAAGLFYDADGLGGAASVRIASFSGAVLLSAADIVVV